MSWGTHFHSPGVLLLMLSFGAGATDAFAFLALGGVFTANMTGNLVLVGLVGRDDYLASLVGAAIAIAVFFVVLLAGFRYAHRSVRVPTLPLLGTAAAVQVLTLVAWWLDVGAVVALVAMSAAAMALQTVVARSSLPEGGLSSTFVTGTMVNIADDLARGRTEHLALRLGAIAALVAGSFAGALSIHAEPRLGPLVAAVVACIGLALAAFVVRR
ncbi:DUF1275 domain-containing protein [Rhodococcus sp. 14-2470-1a]|nr:DUF1275 domain-containing protein [Rhodococcus sp. 06-621-2]OZC81676.1 DUF1275 domain-containing protein [Rhodococcus sp. 06-418-1B]OZD15415.1 DUF1275 domain-containing protein [Rhodococcus sp. 06-156-4C]OZD20169.1 DUF1275 domain-containing protein [Rhodococcus sp. 06-156-4a]OZD23240.1 DUF1275 domain-containing protein [Rhodococcus sp. 06-156-3C]OZD26258.1 DUF1275 domain-containing protein [Rhodococcus sp. 06-156-3b]OZD38394.1 DUF1275 domain-containing protein [Rhodococcus sp. 06-156-3]OZ